VSARAVRLVCGMVWCWVCLGGAALALAAVAVAAEAAEAGALGAGSSQVTFGAREVKPPLALQGGNEAAVTRFAGLLSHDTSPGGNAGRFSSVHAYMEAMWPGAHGAMDLEFMGEGGASLLYTWAGVDPSLPGVMVIAHLDVVPAEKPERWEYGPFAGAVARGFVHGRGAIDVKGVVAGTLEAVEAMAMAGSRPQRTVYLAFSHDEETGGTGAAATARELKRRGVELALVLDEGGVAVPDALPGLEGKLACLIGVAEKGQANYGARVRGTGGHASSPPKETPVGILARALARIETLKLPARIDGATRDMLRHAAEVAWENGAWLRSLVYGHAGTWPLSTLVSLALSAHPAKDAMVRTTVAPTMLSASTQANVLPVLAAANLNVRPLPGDDPEALREALQRLAGDTRVEITLDSGGGAPPVSPSEGPAYEYLAKVARRTFGEASTVALPYLLMGATDSRHYLAHGVGLGVVYRFLPFRLTPDDVVKYVHGIDERLNVTSYLDAVHFYQTLFLNLDALRSSPTEETSQESRHEL